MATTHQALIELAQVYFDGMSHDALCQRIVEVASQLAAADRDDPYRHSCELFAPLLWGEPSGTSIRPDRVAAAFAGTDGAMHAAAWANAARVLTAQRAAA